MAEPLERDAGSLLTVPERMVTKEADSAAKKEYDLLVVGGGVQGAWIALEAARAGGRVFLAEKEDFGSGTSANSLKVLHGGLRYLQHGNLRRIRESRRSVRSMRAVAGSLVEDVPFYLETRGRGVRGRMAMRVALFIFKILCRIWPDGGQGPVGKIVSGDPRKVFPEGAFSENANGVASWNEAVMRNSERLIFEVCRAAEDIGAVCCNYTEVLHLEAEDGGFVVELLDRREEKSFSIRAKKCVEATGPAVEKRLGSSRLSALRGVNLVFAGKPFGNRAVGIESREEKNDPDALVRRGNRLLFFVPRGDQTMVGTWYDRKDTVDTSVADVDLELWLDEIAEVAPDAKLDRARLRYIHCGFLAADDRTGAEVQPAKESAIFEIKSGHWAVRTVKYTTTPEIAREVVSRLGWKPKTRLQGRGEPAEKPWEQLLLSDQLPCQEELREAVVSEKVFTLSDVLLRRTNIALDRELTTGEYQLAATRLAEIFDWSQEKQNDEIARVRQRMCTPVTGGAE